MGLRGDIVIDENHGGQIYTHWRGDDLPQTLQEALREEWRWREESYLARIIFSELIRGQEDGETGFGISTSLRDNEYPFLRVSTKAQTVTVDFASLDAKLDAILDRLHHLESHLLRRKRHPNVVIPFREFIQIPNICWEVLEEYQDESTTIPAGATPNHQPEPTDAPHGTVAHVVGILTTDRGFRK